MANLLTLGYPGISEAHYLHKHIFGWVERARARHRDQILA